MQGKRKLYRMVIYIERYPVILRFAPNDGILF